MGIKDFSLHNTKVELYFTQYETFSLNASFVTLLQGSVVSCAALTD